MMRRSMGIGIVCISLSLITCCSNDNDGIIAPPADTTSPPEATEGTTVTAPQQGEGQEDVRISADIRKAVTEDDALYVNASNMRISTYNGVVTLSGTVDSESERTSIESKADMVPGVVRVVNLLEIEQSQ